MLENFKKDLQQGLKHFEDMCNFFFSQVCNVPTLILQEQRQKIKKEIKLQITHHSTLKPFIMLITAVVGGAYLDKGVEELLKLVFFPVLEAGRTDLQDLIPVKLSCLFVWTFLAGCTRPRRKLAFFARARPERGEKKKASMLPKSKAVSGPLLPSSLCRSAVLTFRFLRRRSTLRWTSSPLLAHIHKY